jgi:hypothetical protein
VTWLAEAYAILSAIGRILPALLRLLRALLDRNDGQGDGAAPDALAADSPASALADRLRALPTTDRIHLTELLMIVADNPGLPLTALEALAPQRGHPWLPTPAPPPPSPH